LLGRDLVAQPRQLGLVVEPHGIGGRDRHVEQRERRAVILLETQNADREGVRLLHAFRRDIEQPLDVVDGERPGAVGIVAAAREARARGQALDLEREIAVPQIRLQQRREVERNAA